MRLKTAASTQRVNPIPARQIEGDAPGGKGTISVEITGPAWRRPPAYELLSWSEALVSSERSAVRTITAKAIQGASK